MDAAALPAPPEQKLSRYRSVRKAARQQEQQHRQDAQTPDVTAMPQAVGGAQKDTISRSMSRYHRSRPTAAVPPLQAQQPASQRALAGQQHVSDQDILLSCSAAETATRVQQGHVSRQKPVQLRETTVSSPQAPTASSPRRLAKNQPTSARDEAEQLLTSEAERHKTMHEKLRVDKMESLEAKEAEAARQRQEKHELDRLKARQDGDEASRNQANRNEDRLRQNLSQEQADRSVRAQRMQREERSRAEESRRMAQASGATPTALPGVLKEGLSFLKRRRGDDAPKSSDVLAEPNARMSADGGAQATIKPGGGGVVPGTDAPVSAVNAGERSVTVERNETTIVLPITPTTTALDLIRSASIRLSEHIDPKSSVLLELFGKVGLQRPLRHYEHVRDVMNSWDDDRQNTLILVDSAGPETDQELKAASVPQRRPEESSYTLYYSQKPGKWDKRCITLRPDGQVVLARNETGKETTNVCHLSDFDIYTPTARQKAKKVKPPKKICFAIKSQQKSNMFMTTSMFVHFLCTNDRRIGEEFYKAVQGWRSWYLVNVMGEGIKKSKLVEAASANPLLVCANTTVGAPDGGHLATHRSNGSTDSYCQLGPFKPVPDMAYSSAPDQPRSSLTRNTPGITGSDAKATLMCNIYPRNRTSPPVSPFANQAGSVATSNPPRPSVSYSTRSQPTSDSGTFALTSLLGRAYSQRHHVPREREAIVMNAGPFTEGPPLLSTIEAACVAQASMGSGPKRMASVRSNRNTARESTDLKRTTSIKRNISVRREMPKPLVDLTPQYREPPQFSKKGRGFHPEQVGPRGLIESATSPEVAIAIPPATDWRGRNGIAAVTSGAGSTARPAADGRPSTSSGSTQSGGPIELTRSRSINRTHSTRRHHDHVPEDSQEAFTGRGLLARTESSQGGHGVMTGANAKGPMLDVRQASRFVAGSLLRRVEIEEEIAGPVIDRGKSSDWDVVSGARV